MRIEKKLTAYADWKDKSRPSIDAVTVALTERYVRKRLKIKSGEPTVFRGMTARCTKQPKAKGVA